MSKVKFNPEHKEFLDGFLLPCYDVQTKKMFGYPAYWINGKMFACLYEDGVGIKIPESLATELLEKSNIIHFQPGNRSKMSEWIQINRKRSSDYEEDKGIFEASMKFVSLISDNEKK